MTNKKAKQATSSKAKKPLARVRNTKHKYKVGDKVRTTGFGISAPARFDNQVCTITKIGSWTGGTHNGSGVPYYTIERDILCTAEDAYTCVFNSEREDALVKLKEV